MPERQPKEMLVRDRVRDLAPAFNVHGPFREAKDEEMPQLLRDTIVADSEKLGEAITSGDIRSATIWSAEIRALIETAANYMGIPHGNIDFEQKQLRIRQGEYSNRVVKTENPRGF